MNLIQKIQELQKGEINNIINKRIKEFEEIGKDNKKIFSELCFCILTANSNAENCIRVQKEIGKKFEKLEENELAKELKEKGCRFHTKRANYICYSRKFKKELITNLKSSKPKEIRDWIVLNIKGLGMKESSHFLRNIGYKEFAIIDFHILDLLEQEKFIKKPEKMNKQEYLKIEKTLEKIGKKVKLTLAELDLYLWYLETGKILK